MLRRSCGSAKDDETTVRLFTFDGKQILFKDQIYKDADVAKSMKVRGETKCAHCKTVHPKKFKVCPNCGFNSTHDTIPQVHSIEPVAKSKSPMMKIIGGIVAAGSAALFAKWAFTAKPYDAMVNDLTWEHRVNAKKFIPVLQDGFVEDLDESPTQFPNQVKGIPGVGGVRFIPGTQHRVVVGYMQKEVDDKSRPIYHQKKIKQIKDLDNDAGQVEDVWVDDTSRPPKGYEQKEVDDKNRPIVKTAVQYETWTWQSMPSLSNQLSTSGTRSGGTEPYWKDLDHSDARIWYDQSASYTANLAMKNSKGGIEAKNISLKDGLSEFKSLNIGDTMVLEIYNIGGVKSYKKVTAEKE